MRTIEQAQIREEGIDVETTPRASDSPKPSANERVRSIGSRLVGAATSEEYDQPAEIVGLGKVSAEHADQKLLQEEISKALAVLDKAGFLEENGENLPAIQTRAVNPLLEQGLITAEEIKEVGVGPDLLIYAKLYNNLQTRDLVIDENTESTLQLIRAKITQYVEDKPKAS